MAVQAIEKGSSGGEGRVTREIDSHTRRNRPKSYPISYDTTGRRSPGDRQSVLSRLGTQLNEIRKLFGLAGRGFLRDEGLYRASALAFDTILGLVPFLAFLVSALKGFGAYQALMREMIRQGIVSTTSLAPQAWQNLAPTTFVAPHFGQSTTCWGWGGVAPGAGCCPPLLMESIIV